MARRPPPEDDLRTAQAVLRPHARAVQGMARALADARRDGYLLGMAQVEAALYGGMGDVFAVLRAAKDVEA